MSRQVSRRPKPKVGSNWDLVGPSASAVARLWEQDIDLPERPAETIPALPNDPTDLDDSQLMMLFTSLTGWLAYTGARLASAEVDEKYADAVLDLIEKRILVENSGAKRVADAKAKFQEDAGYVSAREAATHAFAYRKMLSSVYNATDGKNKLISRELTRRVGREPREERASRWAP